MLAGLAKDRLAALPVSPAVGVGRHVRTLALLATILAVNAGGLGLLRAQRAALGWAVALLFGLDLCIISVDAAKAALRCVWRKCLCVCVAAGCACVDTTPSHCFTAALARVSQPSHALKPHTAASHS
jgi:hypothetical protein